jgi:MYXO-CTERM domain-containing protein
MTWRALLPACLGAIALAASGTLAGCAAPTAWAAEQEGSTGAPIVNGTPSTSSQDASVRINIGTEGQFCTGALIAPNLVLTARHCVQTTEETTECGSFTTRFVPSTLSISLGVLANGTSVAARAKQTFVDSGTTMCSHDVALILLDKDVAGGKIAHVRFDKVQAGESTVAVGYGDDGSGTNTNGRYQRAAKVEAVGPASHTYTTKANQKIDFTVHAGEIATGESTCFGDSGGPLFDAQGRIVGMTSRGLDSECNDRPSIFTDTSSHEKLIRDAATTAGHPLASSADTSSPASDGTGDGTTDSSGDTTTTTTKSKGKSGSTLVPQANAGCAAAPGSASGSHSAKWPSFGLIALAALAMRRRRGAAPCS